MNSLSNVFESFQSTLSIDIPNTNYSDEDCSVLYGISMSLIDSGDIKKAENILQLLVLKRPLNSAFWSLYGQCLIRSKKFSQAVTAFSMSSITNPTAENYTQIAECLFSMGSIEEARKALLEAKKYDTSNELQGKIDLMLDRTQRKTYEDSIT